MSAKQLGAGELVDGSERFLFPELRVPSCALARTRPCPTALRGGLEIEAHLQKREDGEGLSGLTVAARRDTWPAPKRRRNRLGLGAPAQTFNFPFLTSAN